MNVVSRAACWSKRTVLFGVALLMVVLWPQNSLAQDSPIKLFSSTTVSTSASGVDFTHMTVINSTTLSLSCPANPTGKLSNTADGTGNVLVDNYLTLSINGNPVAPFEGPAFSPAGNVCTGGVTDGFNNTTQQDCFSQAYRNAAVSGGINGLDSDSITNGNNNNYTGGQPGGVAPIDISSYLPANQTSQVSIQLLDAGGYVASSSLYIVTNCTRAADVTQQIPTSDTNNVSLPADFSNNGSTLTTTIDYLAPNGLATSPNAPNPVLVTTNSEVPSGVWPQYVVGTPFAPSHCTIKLANGGNMLCSLFINACYQAGADASTASDANCPTIQQPDANNYIVLQDTFDWGNGKWIPTPGNTVSLIAFSVPTSNPGLQWSPSTGATNTVCPTQIPNSILPCYLTDSLLDISGDQTTTRGNSPKTKAWLASAVDVPMLFTSVNVATPGNHLNAGNGTDFSCSPMLNNPPANDNGFAASIWSNSACLLSLVVNPAIGSGNNFQAAQPSFLEYGFAPGIVAPPPVTPGLPDGDHKIDGNPALTCDDSQPACYATPWAAVSGVSLGTFLNATDGTFTFHWSAKDGAGITEKSITLLNESNTTCSTDEAMGKICNYFTNYFSTTVNLDSIYPTVNTFSFSPAGGSYFVGQSNVTANFTCSDPAPANGVASGLASCTAVTDTNNVPFTTGGSISTATAGPHTVTVTAMDNAGNKSWKTYNYTVTQAPAADMAIYEGYSVDVVKHGTTYNYPAWTLDLTKGVAAQGVTVTGTVTIPTSSLSGNVSAKVAVVSCSLSSGCASMTIGSACSLTGNSASNGITTQTVFCNVGTLQSVYNLQGARVQLMIPVSSTAKIGSTFNINAVVGSANDPNSKNNTVKDVITVK